LGPRQGATASGGETEQAPGFLQYSLPSGIKGKQILKDTKHKNLKNKISYIYIYILRNRLYT